MKMISTIPAMPVTEIEPAVGFYVDRLGFTCAYRDGGFARLIRDEVEVHIAPKKSLPHRQPAGQLLGTSK